MSPVIRILSYILLSWILLLNGCSTEVNFDENIEIDTQLKKSIEEYKLLELWKGPSSYVLTISKTQKKDSLFYIISATSSIGVFAEKRVYNHIIFQDQNIFTNFKTKKFNDSLSLKEAAQYLNHDEYTRFIKTNKIPGPDMLWTLRQLRLVFYQNKIVEKSYFFLH